MSVINGRGIFAGGKGKMFEGEPCYFTTTVNSDAPTYGTITRNVITGEGWLITIGSLAFGSGDFPFQYELDGVLFPGNYEFFGGALRTAIIFQKFNERIAQKNSNYNMIVCAMGDKFEDTIPAALGLTGSPSTAAQPVSTKLVTGSGWITHVSAKYKDANNAFTYSYMALAVDGNFLIGGPGYRFDSNMPIDSLFRFKESFEFFGNGEIIYSLED